MVFDKYISFKSDDYLISYLDVPPHKLTMHLHNKYELLWLMHGDASYIIDDTSYRLSEGDILITKPNELHTIIFHSEEHYRRCFIQFSNEFANFLDSNLTSFFDKLSADSNRIIHKDIAEKYNLYSYFENVADYTVNKRPFSHTAVQANISMLLVKLNEVYASMPKKTSAPADRIEKIAAYLTQHPNTSLDELASMFFISKYHLCHTFKNRYGITVKEFVNTRRIAKAKMMIEDGHSITELCYLCGFNDYTTFYKTFKKLTGKTPSDFFRL